MRGGILFVELGIDATNDDILDQMRKMKACREDGSYNNVVCTVRGFADDKRHLFEIPAGGSSIWASSVTSISRRRSILQCRPLRKTAGVLPRCGSVARGGCGARCR